MLRTAWWLQARAALGFFSASRKFDFPAAFDPVRTDSGPSWTSQAAINRKLSNRTHVRSTAAHRTRKKRHV